MPPFSRSIVPAISLGVSLTVTAFLTSCSSGSTSQTTTTIMESIPAAADMRDARYCEVLLISNIGGNTTASVYNTYPLNECPEDEWAALDAQTIASQNGAILALLNGPRHWMINSVEKVGGGSSEKTAFGTLEMYKQATVPIVSLTEQTRAYVPNPVSRSTVFTYDAGTEIFQLLSPEGAIYVMQSFSQQKDPTLTLATLPSLRTKLALPEGWSFDSRILSEDLRIETVNRPAQVLQDDLGNSYSLLPTTPDVGEREQSS